MDEENQRDHEATMRLPLHPRKAQELFFELLQVALPSGDTEAATPRDTPSPQSFQQRVAHAQQYCADALKVMQRGQWVRTVSSSTTKRRADPMRQLRLSRDGASLELYAFTSDASTARELADDEAQQRQEQTVVASVAAIRVASIRSLVVFPTACFAVLTGDRDNATAAATADATDTMESDHALFESPFEAESDDVLACVAVAVASSVSAQRDKASTKQHDALLWQAVRLRIVEMLAAGVLLRDAIVTMEAAYNALTTREAQSELPAREDLFLLRAG